MAGHGYAEDRRTHRDHRKCQDANEKARKPNPVVGSKSGSAGAATASNSGDSGYDDVVIVSLRLQGRALPDRTEGTEKGQQELRVNWHKAREGGR